MLPGELEGKDTKVFSRFDLKLNKIRMYKKKSQWLASVCLKPLKR